MLHIYFDVAPKPFFTNGTNEHFFNYSIPYRHSSVQHAKASSVLEPPGKPSMVWTPPPCRVFSGQQSVNPFQHRHREVNFFEQTQTPRWASLLDDVVLACPRTHDCFSNMVADKCIKLNLQQKGCNAGRILAHCRNVIQSTLSKHYPMSYKIGFTHDPCFRFHNPTFGYSRNKCQMMIVMFVSHDPTPAAFVEASMIQLFMGNFGYIY